MFRRRKEQAALRRTSSDVYGSIVAQARHETFYRRWRVPDTMEGRLEMIILHVGLVLDRLGAEGPAGQSLGQAISEAYIADVDDALRQIGTGDMGVPRRVKKAAAALRERRMVYGRALQADTRSDLVEAVRRFVLPDSEENDANTDAATAIASYIVRVAHDLSALTSDTLLAGKVAFPQPDSPADD